MDNKNSPTSKMMDRFTQEQLEDIINIFETNSTTKARPLLYQRYGVKGYEVSTLYSELVQAGFSRDHMKDKWPIEQTEKFKSLVEKGYDISEIANYFQKTTSTIKNKIIKEYGCLPLIEFPDEEWRDSFSLEGYQVSNKGRIRNNITQKIYRGTFNKNDGGLEFKSCKIHRLVAEVFIPNPDNKPYVDHIDTDRANNDVTNLRWVTPKENMNNDKTRENLSEGWRKKKKKDEAVFLIKQALELVPNKLELIQLVIQTKLPNIENDI